MTTTSPISRRLPRLFAPAAFAAALLAGWSGSASADSILTEHALLPGVHINGATGVFRTTVDIFNPSETRSVYVFLYYTPADTDGTTIPGITLSQPLAPRESVTLQDIVLTYFQRNSSFGLLDIQGYEGNSINSTPASIVVTSNTFNVGGATPGTYGQFSPGQPFRAALGFDNSVFGDLYITGLQNDPNFRTNAVVMNPSSKALEAGVSLVDSLGLVYGTRTVNVPPYSMSQLNDVFGNAFAGFSPAAGGPYRLTVFVNLGNGAKVLCYATVTDKRTGDPYLITGQSLLP